jgi:hypothetical protein
VKSQHSRYFIVQSAIKVCLGHGRVVRPCRLPTESVIVIECVWVSPTPPSPRLQLERPLDRYLEPLATALQLRTSLTQEPNGLEVGEADAKPVFQ